MFFRPVFRHTRRQNQGARAETPTWEVQDRRQLAPLGPPVPRRSSRSHGARSGCKPTGVRLRAEWGQTARMGSGCEPSRVASCGRNNGLKIAVSRKA